MPKPILMPMLSPSMTEGVLVRWVKKEGDAVKSGEVLAEVETDKATMDLEAFDSGVLRKILVQEGNKVPINAPIGVIGAKDEAIDDLVKELSSGGKSKPAPAPDKKAAAAPVKISKPGEKEQAPVPSSDGRLKASPYARRLAAEQGGDLGGVAGSGPGGRIVARDVGGSRPFVPNAPGTPEPLSSVRQTIARRLVESKRTAPHFYLRVEIDAAPLTQLRASLNDALKENANALKFSVNDFVLRACAIALREVPDVNVAFAGDTLWRYQDVNVAFAVALEGGLITPVIAAADGKSLAQISREARELAGRAKQGKLKLEEYETGTFSVSNLGMFGIDEFAAILNPPQAAILAVGAVVAKPVLDAHGAVVPGQRMMLTLSCDHRAVDGALGATFLQKLRELLEKPAVLLSEG